MQKKLRETKQRKAIRTVLESNRHPLSAREIHEAAQKSIPSIGLATIYRNIKAMVEAGAIEQIELPNQITCYLLPREAKAPLLVCRESSRVEILADQAVFFDQKKVPSHFEPDTYELIVMGRFAGSSAGN